MKKRVFILGADGMLGSTLHFFLREKENIEVYSVLRKPHDKIQGKNIIYINSVENFEDLYIKEGDYVINCIGLTNRHNNLLEMIRINSLFPHQLAEYCKKNKAKLIHISTNCVFDITKIGELRNESSETDDLTHYGKTKSLGEPEDVMVIRTSIIGFEIKNYYSFLTWVLRNKNKIVTGYKNSYWNGLTTLELSKVIYQIITNECYDKCWRKGVYHFFGEKLTKYDMIKHISHIFNLNIFLEEDYNKKQDYCLSSHKWLLRNVFYDKIFCDQIENLKKFGKRHNLYDDFI